MRRKARYGTQVKTTIPGTIPCTKQWSAATLTQSIVGAARNSYMVSPPAYLWTSIAVWAPGFAIPGEHSASPHMPLGIKKYLQVPASILLEEDSSTPRAHLTSYNDIDSIGGRQPLSSFHHRRQQGLETSILSPLSPIKPSPSSIKGDALPPTRGDQLHKAQTH